jgi:hypothetical protein
MNASLKVLKEESIRLERILKIKTILLKLPLNILMEKEIKDLIKMFLDFNQRLDRIYNSFKEEKESQNALNKNTINEKEIQIENSFKELKKIDLNLKQRADELMTNYYIRVEEDNKALGKNVKNVNDEDDDLSSRRSSGSEMSSINGENENLQCTKVFLNSIISTNNVTILLRKKTLLEEKQYINEIFGIDELFPTSESKRLILLDYFMNCYNFCHNGNFTIQQISIIMSIFYFLFSYAFIGESCSYEKCLYVFNDILEFHSLNRVPYSYEFFDENEKERIYNFGKKTFFRNYSLFENIYRYDISICFFSKFPEKIPYKNFNKIEDYELKNENEQQIENEKLPEILKTIIKEKDLNKNIKKEKKDDYDDDDDERSKDELEEEEQLQKLDNFINSFYQASAVVEQQRLAEINKMNKKLNEGEANQAKGYLDVKIPEIKKEIGEMVEVSTKNVIKPVNDELKEKEAEKNKKK